MADNVTSHQNLLNFRQNYRKNWSEDKAKRLVQTFRKPAALLRAVNCRPKQRALTLYTQCHVAVAV